MIGVLDVIRLLVPMITGYGMGAICPIGRTAGADIPARPKGWVFGVMWTILYILIGITWAVTARKNPMYDLAFIVLTLSLLTWTYFWGCRDNKRYALYTLFVSIMITLFITLSLVAEGDKIGLMLVPLMVWLLLAGLLNYTSVNNE